MIPPGPASHTHDTNTAARDREIRLVQTRDEAVREVEMLRADLITVVPDDHEPPSTSSTNPIPTTTTPANAA